MSAPEPAIMSSMEISDIPPLVRPEATERAAAEVERMVDALRALGPDDWTQPTACALWDVRAMAGHVLGMTETFTGLLSMARTMRAGGKAAGDGPMIDGVTAVQVEATARLSTSELIDRLAVAGPKSARWRGRRRLLRAAPMKQDMPDGTKETWRMGYLLDIILTRDTWMHRSDLAEAVGRPMTLTAAHDGRIVANAVAEWARRHGQPFQLHLTGPAGGEFHQGTAGDTITLDAVKFCRTIGGRGTGEGLLAQEVPF